MTIASIENAEYSFKLFFVFVLVVEKIRQENNTRMDSPEVAFRRRLYFFYRFMNIGMDCMREQLVVHSSGRNNIGNRLI